MIPAQASGFPPKVEVWDPRGIFPATAAERSAAPTGMPPASPLPRVTIS